MSLSLVAYIKTWLLLERRAELRGGKKKTELEDNIHSLVPQSLQFKFSVILLCADHTSLFMYQIFQSASTLASELAV